MMTSGSLRTDLPATCGGPWRMQIQKRANGPYHTLIRGRPGGKGYASMAIGYLSADAQGARVRDTLLLAINAEDAKVRGSPLEDRLLRLRRKTDGQPVLRYLLTGDESVFEEEAEDFGELTLREYHDRVWWPVRTGAPDLRPHAQALRVPPPARPWR